jgi:SAM-dependent methyltransferase
MLRRRGRIRLVICELLPYLRTRSSFPTLDPACHGTGSRIRCEVPGGELQLPGCLEGRVLSVRGPRRGHPLDTKAQPIDTSRRFGFQWDRYRELTPHFRAQFVQWIAPFDPSDLHERDVLDAGCGMGRNAYWAAEFGARSVTAVDASELAVESARVVLADVPGVSVRRESLYDLRDRDRYDVCLSLGVIHHLEFPRRALERLLDALRPGGTLVVWLYGYEGNELWVRLFKLLHPLLRRLPPRLLHALAHLFALPLYALLKLPVPRSEYLKGLARHPYPHVRLILLDQLVPDIAHYYKRAEVEALFEDFPVSSCAIHHNRGYSWTVICRK